MTDEIKAKMLMCGEVEIQGEDRENLLVLEALDTDWSVHGGIYYVVSETGRKKLHETDRLQKLFREAKWIEFNNGTAWQAVHGGWNVYQRDGKEWEFMEQISDEAALDREEAQHK